MMSFASPIFFFMTLFSLSIAEVVSMDSVSDFNDLRSCGNYCFGYRSPGFRLDTLAQVLSCDSNEVIENSCFCRADLQDTGVKHLSTCVSSSCSGNMVDVAAATQLYKDYCTSAGYTAAPRTVKAQSTGGTTLDTAITLATATAKGDNGTPIETDPPLSPTESSSIKRPNIKLGETIGIIAGVVAALAGVIGAFFGFKRYQQLKRTQEQKRLEILNNSRAPGYRY